MGNNKKKKKTRSNKPAPSVSSAVVTSSLPVPTSAQNLPQEHEPVGIPLLADYGDAVYEGIMRSNYPEEEAGQQEQYEQLINEPEANLEAFRMQWQAELHQQRESVPRTETTEESEVLKSRKKKTEADNIAPIEVDDVTEMTEIWKTDLRIDEAEVVKAPPPTPEIKTSAIENEARELFLAGVQLESTGDVMAAVHKYKAAMKLVPDIERRIYQAPTAKADNKDTSQKAISVSRVDGEDEPLYNALSRRICEQGARFVAEQSNDPCYMQLLPVEVLTTLMRYIVGSELDTRQLEIMSRTSAMFYLLARDNELWKRIIRRSRHSSQADKWLQTTTNKTPGLGTLSWRDFYLQMPHLFFHGVYASKRSYIREGEKAFLDKDSPSFHIVTYYRLVRFYADGRMFMMTSNDAPLTSANQLKMIPAVTDRNILQGRYTLENDVITAVLYRYCEPATTTGKAKRPLLGAKKKQIVVQHGIASQSFAVRFHLKKSRAVGWSLLWAQNHCHIVYFNGDKSMSDLESERDTQAYPPLRFFAINGYIDCCSGKLE